MLLLTNGTVCESYCLCVTTELNLSTNEGALYSTLALNSLNKLAWIEREKDIDKRERCMSVLYNMRENATRGLLILHFVQQAPVVVTLIMCFAICHISPLKYWVGH